MKYYVRSLELEVVIAGEHIESPMDAACEALLTHYKDHKLSPFIIVNERGFDYWGHHHTEDTLLDTDKVMAKAGFTFEE